MTLTSLRGWLRNILYVCILALIFIVRQVPEVQAAAIAVDATCSLSDAITATNTNTATGGCRGGQRGGHHHANRRMWKSSISTLVLSSEAHDRRRISHNFRVGKQTSV